MCLVPKPYLIPYPRSWVLFPHTDRGAVSESLRYEATLDSPAFCVLHLPRSPSKPTWTRNINSVGDPNSCHLLPSRPSPGQQAGEAWRTKSDYRRGKEENSSEVALPPQIARKGNSEKLESADLERLCGLCLWVTETPEMLIDTSILELAGLTHLQSRNQGKALIVRCTYVLPETLTNLGKAHKSFLPVLRDFSKIKKMQRKFQNWYQSQLGPILFDFPAWQG